VWIGISFCRCEGGVLYIDAGIDRMLLLFLCLSQCNFYISDVDMLRKLNRSRYQIDIISIVFRSCSCVVLHMLRCVLFRSFSLFFYTCVFHVFSLFLIFSFLQFTFFPFFSAKEMNPWIAYHWCHLSLQD
jgi:hypothetical protein